MQKCSPWLSELMWQFLAKVTSEVMVLIWMSLYYKKISVAYFPSMMMSSAGLFTSQFTSAGIV